MSQSLDQLRASQERLDRDFAFCIQDLDQGGLVNGEVVNRKFDKGRAVLRVCNYLKIPVENSVAFGDSMNDREMIETAGLGICMENGSPELKRIADDICPPVGENGLWEGFRRHGLI